MEEQEEDNLCIIKRKQWKISENHNNLSVKWRNEVEIVLYEKPKKILLQNKSCKWNPSKN